MQHQCIGDGAAIATVTISLIGYQDIVFAFKVQCGGIRFYVNIGTTSGASDVVSNGVPTLPYSMSLHTAVVGASVDVSTFYMFISHGMLSSCSTENV